MTTIAEVLAEHTPFTDDVVTTLHPVRCGCTYGPDRADLPAMTWLEWIAHLAAALQPLIDAEKRAAEADVLAAFARHDLHGLLPYADIGNPWYHSGIDAAQHEALEWSETRRDALTTKDA